MSYKIYIYSDTFATLTALILKGLAQSTQLYIYDEANLIQNRLWTFSSAAFIPNVKAEDTITKEHAVPVIISTNSEDPTPQGYKPIIYQSITRKPNIETGIVISQSKEEATALCEVCKINISQCEIYIKNQNTWSKILI